jgi:membrane fusion protein (multidrug efflux system)
MRQLTKHVALLLGVSIGLPLFSFQMLLGAEKTFSAIVLPVREVSVSAVVPGVVVAVDLEEGATIQQGGRLAKLNDEEELLALKLSAKILEKRRYDYKNAQSLFDQRVISEEEALEKKIELDIAEIELKRSETSLKRRSLEAPLGGVVVARFFEVGEWVEPGDVLFEIVDIDQVFLEVLMTAADSKYTQIGQSVPVEVSTMEAVPMQGVVSFIEPRLDASSGLRRVRILVENESQAIRPGMRGTVTTNPTSE